MNTDTIPQEKPIYFTSKLLNKLICAFVGYYDGEIKQFELGYNNELSLATAQSKFKPKVLIVARKFYIEKLKKYPIEDKKELKKFLSLEYAKETSCFYVWLRDNDSSVVNIWQYKDNVPNAFIRFPESLIFAMTSVVSKKDSSELITVLANEDLYITKQIGI